jgi:hypothetical protein
MSTRKFIAGIILALVVLFPFRMAYLDQPDMGPKSLLNFLLVIAGCAVFGILISGEKKREPSMVAEKKLDHQQKKAA